MKKWILLSIILIFAPGFALGECKHVKPGPHNNSKLYEIDYKKCKSYGGLYAGEDNQGKPYCVIAKDGWCDSYDTFGCYVGPYCWSDACCEDGRCDNNNPSCWKHSR